MEFLENILFYLGHGSIEIISFLGYFGVFILMTMESMVFPVPSELVMPFAGFLTASGELDFILVVIFSSFGSIFGSLLSYYIGKYGGIKLIKVYGKYFFLDEVDLQKTENWFQKSGDKTIFISRFIPIVRHLISIPAGIGKMDLKKFLLYTILGATIWNAFLAYLGFLLGQNWESVRNYSKYLTIIVLILLIVFGSYYIYRHIKHKMLLKKKDDVVK